MICQFKGECSSNERPQQPMDTLDAALNELGMLNTVTPARRQYIEEISCKFTDMIQKNSRYVTNVSFGLCIKPACDKNRVRPYTKKHGRCTDRELRMAKYATYVQERQRTRSENADFPSPGLITITPIVETVVDMAIDLAKQEASSQLNNNLIPKIDLKTKKSGMKKTKSLENVRIENDNASQPSHEMEFVSSRIQRLKMND